jgi:probable F420-dependent oxidoreductase
MKVGVNLINFGPGARPDTLVRRVRLIESLGYHLLMTSDHIAITSDVHGRYPAPFYEPFSTLGWLAGITQHMVLGTTVIILPYRNILETARVMANIDQLSGGRLIVGVGVGWAQQEFEVLGVPFHQRGAITNEYLEALTLLWTQEVASYEGRFISFQNVYTAPRPVQSPHPPIWVGGSSDAALRRAVRYGNGWHPIRIRLAPFLDRDMPRLRAIADTENRPVPAVCPRIRLRLTASPLADEQRCAGEGTVDQVRRDMAALQSLGCPYVLLDTYDDNPEATRHPEAEWRMLATMAEQVLDLPNEALR